MTRTYNRDQAWSLLTAHIQQPSMLRHSRASEIVMRKLAQHFGEDEEKWAITGLLHDLDVELTDANAKRHGLESRPLLEKLGLESDAIEAIEMHNEAATEKKRTTKFQHALAAGETITGLIMATAMVYPDKKLTSVKPSSVVKRMKEKLFAASVNRDIIRECEIIGIPLPEFAEMCVVEMQKYADELNPANPISSQL